MFKARLLCLIVLLRSTAYVLVVNIIEEGDWQDYKSFRSIYIGASSRKHQNSSTFCSAGIIRRMKLKFNFSLDRKRLKFSLELAILFLGVKHASL